MAEFSYKCCGLISDFMNQEINKCYNAKIFFKLVEKVFSSWKQNTINYFLMKKSGLNFAFF